MTQMTRLDVGCGAFPTGDVNCDLYPTDTYGHRNGIGTTLNVKAIPNFIVCDALHLPFRNGAFSEVFSAQIIEHLHEPLRLLMELKRVSRCKIKVETVHHIGENFCTGIRWRRWLRTHHVSKFNVKWFRLAAPLINCRFERSYTLEYKNFPFEYVPLFRFPFKFGVELTRND